MEETQLCVVPKSGVWCTQPLVSTDPVPLCAMHRMEIVIQALPDILLGMHDIERSLMVTGESVGDRAALAVLPLRLPAKHAPIVYFVKNGDRVKIGYTTNLSSRLQSFALRRESVILTLVGDGSLERVLHARFKTIRVPGTEWFECKKPLLDYVQGRMQYGLRMPLHDQTAPVTGFRMGTSDATDLFDARLKELITSGVPKVTFNSFRDLPSKTGHSRAWVYSQLNRAVARGVLDKDGGTYWPRDTGEPLT